MNPYKVLVLGARPPIDVAEAMQCTKSYFMSRTKLDIQFDYQFVDRQFQLKQWNIKDKNGNECYGTSGYRELLGELKINALKYNAIILIYDASKTFWWTYKPGTLCNWTHWDTFQGASLIELASTIQWGTRDLYRVMTHELIHSFHKSCRLNGFPTLDTMDLYDDENNVESKTGNRERNIKELDGKWRIVSTQTWSQYLFPETAIYLKNAIISIMNPISTGIEKWANAIKKHEGFFVGSRSYRNNNPGNFRYSSVGYLPIYGNVGKDKDGFAIFPTYEQGYKYLCNFLKSVASGKSSTYTAQAKSRGLKDSSELTIPQFCSIYAPSSDGNDPINYALIICNEIGISLDTKIKNII